MSKGVQRSSQPAAFVLLLVVVLVGGQSRPAAESLAPLDRDALGGTNLRQLVRLDTPWGTYWQYAGSARPRGVLVVVHGSLGKNESAVDLAERFIRRWLEFAERQALLVLAPAFDAENYQAAYGGYRGLFGRRIGADEFVNRIVDRYRPAVPDWDGRFDLYGHSAGGQFAGRYAVRHPQRLRSVVLSTPGRYAYPDPDVAWPFGMGRLERRLEWAKDDVQTVRIEPDPAGWKAAAVLPIAVVVGALDTEPQPGRPGHVGTTRISLAEHWVAAMRTLAPDEDASGVTFELVPLVAHDSADLTPACQRALERIWRSLRRDRDVPTTAPASDDLSTGESVPA